MSVRSPVKTSLQFSEMPDSHYAIHKHVYSNAVKSDWGKSSAHKNQTTIRTSSRGQVLNVIG
jgi:hypothetical protein